ncbi:MAG: hypothetical protein ABFS38_14540 [Bacteroidota bacterium]
MAKRWTNIVIVGFLILCSTSFYKLTFVGASMEKGLQLIGGVITIVLIIFHLIYSEQKNIKQNYSLALFLIVFSMLTSMVTAYVTRDQRFIYTLFAQRALYFYFLYFLLHQLKIDPKDLEKMIIFFALVYVAVHLVQTIVYPRIITNGTIRVERGTIRIYTMGADYIATAFLIYLQRFLRLNKFKYLFMLFVIISIYIMRGGRSSIAIQALTVVLFLIIDRKVRSRFFLVILGLIGSFAIFMIFQNIFLELFQQSQVDASKGEDYIRIRAVRYYLTDFFEYPIAYITGNGMQYPHSNYGKLVRLNAIKYRFFLSDIGLIGNYVNYGFFFVLGVLGIFARTMRLKIEPDYIYVKYLFVAIIIGILTSGAFAESDFIGMIVCLMYLVDTSNNTYLQKLEAT